MKRRTFSRRTFIKTLGAISLPSIDPRVFKSQWLTGAGDRLKTLRKFGRDKGKFGVIDQSGDFILPPVYDSWLLFSEGLADIKFGSKYGYIDKTGQVVIEPVYWNAHWFKDGLAPVAKEEGKWGYIDLVGEVIIKMKSGHHGRSFHDGLAGVQKNDKWGFIDKNGRWVIKPFYHTD